MYNAWINNDFCIRLLREDIILDLVNLLNGEELHGKYQSW